MKKSSGIFVMLFSFLLLSAFFTSCEFNNNGGKKTAICTWVNVNPEADVERFVFYSNKQVEEYIKGGSRNETKLYYTGNPQKVGTVIIYFYMGKTEMPLFECNIQNVANNVLTVNINTLGGVTRWTLKTGDGKSSSTDSTLYRVNHPAMSFSRGESKYPDGCRIRAENSKGNYIEQAKKGEKIFVFVEVPSYSGLELKKNSFSVKTSSGTEVPVTFVREEEDNNQALVITVYSFTMPASDVTFEADFQPDANAHRVTTVYNAYGQYNGRGDYCRQGKECKIYLDPDEGYEIDAISVTDANGNEINGTLADAEAFDTEFQKISSKYKFVYVFTMPDTDVTVKATFRRPAGYLFNITTDSYNGTVSADKTRATSGQSITLLLSAYDGYEFHSLDIHEDDHNLHPPVPWQEVIVGEEYSFIMPENDVYVFAHFIEKN